MTQAHTSVQTRLGMLLVRNLLLRLILILGGVNFIASFHYRLYVTPSRKLFKIYSSIGLASIDADNPISDSIAFK